MTVLMKAFKQCFNVWVLLIMLHTMVLLLSLDIEQYFRVLHILLFKVVLS